jgi:hypothetical protein
LARLCTVAASKVSLITVEYDVRDDEPEHTDVFRLQSASPELVTEWLKQGFSHISQTALFICFVREVHANTKTL